MQYVLIALGAYLTGATSFKVKSLTVSLANTGTGPKRFSFATALAAAEHAVLLSGVTLPATIVVGSTSVTVS